MNEYQRAYAEDMASTPPELRCWCGWWRLDEKHPSCSCRSGVLAGLTCADKTKVMCPDPGCRSAPIPGREPIHTIGCQLSRSKTTNDQLCHKCKRRAQSAEDLNAQMMDGSKWGRCAHCDSIWMCGLPTTIAFNEWHEWRFALEQFFPNKGLDARLCGAIARLAKTTDYPRSQTKSLHCISRPEDLTRIPDAVLLSKANIGPKMISRIREVFPFGGVDHFSNQVQVQVQVQVNNPKVREWLLEHPERLAEILEAEYDRQHGPKRPDYASGYRAGYDAGFDAGRRTP